MARNIAQTLFTSLSTMETDAASFQEHVNSSSVDHDQGLLELAEAYEVVNLSRSYLAGYSAVILRLLMITPSCFRETLQQTSLVTEYALFNLSNLLSSLEAFYAIYTLMQLHVRLLK